MKKFFITTAIDYVNSIPHVGTAYEKIGADILARFNRMDGKHVLFQMGNDEHSVNVKKAAIEAGLAPFEYCRQMRPRFEEVWKKLSVSNDLFIQTSSQRHHAAVKKLFGLIHENGDIVEGDYEGPYCESCEAFYTEKDLTDGVCPQHKTKPKWICEKNYFFRLSKYSEKLIGHIEAHPEFILPEIRRNEIVNVIKSGLKDVSISRSGFDWGIPLPANPKHVVYVWFDALINYLTLIGFADDPETFAQWWPADCHVIGKDITRFHCVIWPAMLMSAGLPLPKTVFGHGFVYLKGEKMSKSAGNVVGPADIADKYGADALRYCLMRPASFGSDSNFTWDDFINRYNSDLANGLGNLASRTAGMIKRYFGGKLAPADLSGGDKILSHKFEEMLEKERSLLDPQKSGDIMFNRVLEGIWAWIAEADRYIDAMAPWVLAKQKNEKRLKEVLTTVSKTIFSIAILLSPFLPVTSEKIWNMFGWDKKTPFGKVDFKTTWDGDCVVTIGEHGPLFPRIIQE